MPNHVRNNCVVIGPAADIQALLNLMIREEDGKPCFDFNRILPMPEPLQHVVSGFANIDGKECRVWRTNAEGEDEAIPDEEIARWRCEFGATNWYDWAIQNWGTKWNAYSFHAPDAVEGSRRVSFAFDTAWACPIPVFEALAERFPTLGFRVHWEDEGGPEGIEKFGLPTENSEEAA